MGKNSVNAREAGLALIGQINRWLIAGAVVLTLAISVAAARSFSGHKHTGGSTGSQPNSSAGSTTSTTSSTSASSGSGLQQPSTTPSSSPTPSPAPAQSSPAVSGGS